MRIHPSDAVLVTPLALVLSAAAHGQSAEKLWTTHCAKCHGDSAQGGGAGTESLLKLEKMDQSLDRVFFDAIKLGRRDNGMEAFGEALTDAQCWSLVVHIRELQQQAERKRAGSPKRVDGVYQSRHHRYAIEDVVRNGVRTPWAVDWLPDGTMLITERGGSLRSFKNGKLSEPIAGTPENREVGQGGLMDVAVHPDYEKNRWVYLTYADPKVAGERGPTFTRVVRGKIADGAWTDTQVIWEANRDHYVNSGLHFGSRIVFVKPHGSDTHLLFWCMGDRGENPGRSFEQGAQLLTRPTGKVHRIWDDGTIPEDNPFIDVKDAYKSIWSFGHRNPQGMTLDLDGNLWITEHGPRGGDELNIILKGRNYGWPVVTYGINYNDTPINTPFPDVAGERAVSLNIVMPVYRWLPSIGACGLDVMRDPRPGTGPWLEMWRGDLFAGGLSGANVDRIRVKKNDSGGFDVVEREEILHGMGRVRDVVCGSDGCIYVVLNDPDKIVRIRVAETSK